MEEHSSWAAKVANAMNESMERSPFPGRPRFSNRTIYKLPACVTALNPNSFNPQIVSFGPYHHGAASRLKPMEEHKWRGLRHFMKRISRDSNTLEELVSGVSEVVDELKDCYDSLDPLWHEEDSESFVKLMVLDGCFMLEILRTDSVGNDYEPDDPVFSDHGRLNILPYIRRDMLLLENQLPMLLLDTLLYFETGQNKEKNDQVINKLILNFFDQRESRVPNKCLHVLDVYRKGLSHEPEPATRQQSSYVDDDIEDGSALIIRLPTATELHEAGLNLKPSNSTNLRDISFSNSVLRLPTVVVDDTTESTFLNLTSFERFHVGAGNDVISFIYFMGSIVHSERDVALLRSKGVIQNAMGSNQEVAMMFNSLSRHVSSHVNTDKYGYLMVLHRAVNHYCNKPRHAWRAHFANLNHTYFRSPWASISLVATIFLFGLASTQTFFTVYPNK